MSNGITLDEAKSHRAVEKYVEDGDSSYLVVRPYGNCVLFHNLAQSSNVKMGNVAIEGERNLRVHVKPIGESR